LELQQLGEANPDEVRLREEIKGRGKEELMRSTKADLQKQRDEVMTDRFNLVTDLQSQIDTAQSKIVNQETYIAELEERLEGLYAEGKAPMPDAVRLELERARDEVREASAAVKAANQQSYIAVLERDTALARIAELEERLEATLEPLDLDEYSARLEARVEELEERLKEPDEDAEAYTKELEDRIEKLGDQDEEVKNLRYQLEVITTVLACVTPSPEEWELISVALADMRKNHS
jgi:predicted  nucleic acid-binding Zn-ribbon protein